MPRIDFTQQGIAATGVPDLPMQRPNQAFSQLGQQAAAADQILQQIKQRDAAMTGAQALADFRLQRQQRQVELRTQAKTPDGFVDTAMADFDEHAQQLIDAHDDPDVQMFLEQRLIDARDAEAGDAIQWQAGAMQARSEALAVDTINKYGNMVNTNPRAFQSSLHDIDAMIETSGLDMVHAEKMRATAKATLARSAVYGQIETNPAGILHELQSGQWDAYLDADAKISAVNGAQAEIKRRQAEARANQALARQEMADNVRQWHQDNLASIQMTGKPVDPPYTPEQIKSVMGEHAYGAMARDLQATTQLREVVGPMSVQTDAEIGAKIAALAPKPGQQGFKEQLDLFNAARGAWASSQKLWEADPAGQAAAGFEKARNAWAFYQQKPVKEQLRDAVGASLRAQTAKGIDASKQKPLPVNFAKAVATEILAAPPDKAAVTLQKWATDFGAYWPKVFQQIAPQLDSHSAIAATIKSPNAAAVLLETTRAFGGNKGAGIAALRSQLGVKSEVADAIAEDSTMQTMRTALAQRAGGMKTAADLSSSVELLAYGLMSRNSMSASAATDEAIKQVVGNNYSTTYTNSVPTFVPKQYADGSDVNASRVEGGFEIVLDNLKGEELDLPAADPGALRADTASRYLNAIKSTGYWVTDPGEESATLYVNQHPVTAGGRPITRRFRDLEQLTTNHPVTYSAPSGPGVF